MTNGECIYRKTVDYMSRMALDKDDFRRFSMIWEFRVTGNWVAARVKGGNGPLKTSYHNCLNIPFCRLFNVSCLGSDSLQDDGFEDQNKQACSPGSSLS